MKRRKDTQILEELWYGRICPISTTDDREEAYRELADLYARNEEKLLPTLN